MVGLISCMCGAENWLLIDLVLFVKKVAKSSAVKEVVGGWWRRTEERAECFEEVVVSDKLCQERDRNPTAGEK